MDFNIHFLTAIAVHAVHRPVCCCLNIDLAAGYHKSPCKNHIILIVVPEYKQNVVTGQFQGHILVGDTERIMDVIIIGIKRKAVVVDRVYFVTIDVFV